jgi:hypothetical protein
VPRVVQRAKVRHLGMVLNDHTYKPYFFVFSDLVVCQDDEDHRYLFDQNDFFRVSKQCIEKHSVAGPERIEFDPLFEGASTLRADLDAWCRVDNFIFERWKSGKIAFSRRLEYSNEACRSRLMGFLRAWSYNTSVEVVSIPSLSGGDTVTVRRVRRQSAFHKWLSLEKKVLEATSFNADDVDKIYGNEEEFTISFRKGKSMKCHSRGWDVSRG